MNFWYAGCGPCRAEASTLEDTYQTVSAKGARFLGVNIYDGPEQATAFEKTYGALDDYDVNKLYVDEESLAARGLTVTVVEREGPAAGASTGNAGAFAFTDILPLASPRIIRQAPKWLLDPLGPLSIPPSYALTLLPWLYRFWRASFPAQVAASTITQTTRSPPVRGRGLKQR